MTRIRRPDWDAIREMPAGPAMDARVAELVMGWKDVQPEAYTPSGRALCGTPPQSDAVAPNPWGNGRAYVPRYSTEPGDAYRVFMRLRALCEADPGTTWLRIEWAMEDMRDLEAPLHGWLAWLFLKADWPLALCRAALAITEGEKQ